MRSIQLLNCFPLLPQSTASDSDKKFRTGAVKSKNKIFIFKSTIHPSPLAATTKRFGAVGRLRRINLNL